MTISDDNEPLLRFDFRSITAADIPGPTAGPGELHRFVQRLRGQYPMPRSVQWRQVLARPEDWGLLACGSALFAWHRRHHFGFGDEPVFDNHAQFLSVRGVVRRMGEVLAALEGRGAPLTDDDWAKADVDGMWNAWEAPLIAAAEAGRREYERLSRLPTERRATVDGLQIVATVRWLDHGGPELRVVQDDRLVVKGRVMYRATWSAGSCSARCRRRSLSRPCANATCCREPRWPGRSSRKAMTRRRHEVWADGAVLTRRIDAVRSQHDD